MITFQIVRSAAVTPAVRVHVDSCDITEPLLKRSLNIYPMCPRGFEYGFSGPGPSQLAFALLLYYFTETGAIDPVDLTRRHYLAFLRDFIVPQAFEADGRTRIVAWELTARQIQTWLTARQDLQGARYI